MENSEIGKKVLTDGLDHYYGSNKSTRKETGKTHLCEM